MNRSQKAIYAILIAGSLMAPVVVMADTATTTDNATPAGTNNSQLNSTGNPGNGSSTDGTKVVGGQTTPPKKHHHHKKAATTTSPSGTTSSTPSSMTTGAANQ